MRPYFSNIHNQKRLVDELEEWQNTPYRHFMAIKNRGADCTLFIGKVYQNIGVLKNLDYEFYPKDFHLHMKNELVLDLIFRNALKNTTDGIVIKQIKNPKPEELIFGDVLTFNNPKREIHISHHTSIWVGPYKNMGGNSMVNSIENRGVCCVQMGNYWIKRLTNCFRVMEK